MNDEEQLKWEIETVREGISRDWKMLASKDLDADQRSGIKEHLLIYVSTLNDLMKRSRSASQKFKFERLRQSNTERLSLQNKNH